MIYAYVRVSTDKQTVENQKMELLHFARKKGLIIDEFIEETISGTKQVVDRELGELLDSLHEGDTIIISELSRIARKLLEIMEFLNKIMHKKVRLLSAKEGYELGDNINSKVLAFAFGLSAEIERNLISQRTEEGLKRRIAMGIKMGRPKGAVTRKKHPLEKKMNEIQEYLNAGMSKSAIARIVGVHRITLTTFLNRLDNIEQEEVEKFNQNREKKATSQLKKYLPRYKKGDLVYLERNKKALINFKNEGYPYSTLAVVLGVSEDSLKNILR